MTIFLKADKIFDKIRRKEYNIVKYKCTCVQGGFYEKENR